MKKLNLFTLSLSLLFTFLSVGINTSSAAISAKDYGTILNLSGKQRMLSQKMSKESVLIALVVDKDKNLSALQKTSSLFDKTLKGLRDGDKSLALPKTEAKRILKQLKKIDKIWQPFFKVIKEIITAKSATKANIKYIAGNSLKLLKNMNKGVKLYEKEAVKSGLKGKPGLAVSINLSGKQRMLTQKMSKEFFLVAYGHDVKGNQMNLMETSQLFDRTLTGLVKGDKVLDLPATTNSGIVAQLGKVKTLWIPFQSAIKVGIEQAKIPSDKVKIIADSNLPLLKAMNAAVGMYAKEAAK